MTRLVYLPPILGPSKINEHPYYRANKLTTPAILETIFWKNDDTAYKPSKFAKELHKSMLKSHADDICLNIFSEKFRRNNIQNRNKYNAPPPSP